MFYTDKYEGVTNTIFHTCPVLNQYEAGNDCQCRKSHGGENYKVSDSTSISLDSETYQNNFNIDIDLMNHNSFTSLMVCFCRAWKDLKIPIKTRSFNPLSVPIPIIDKSMQINVSYLILYQVLSIKQKKTLRRVHLISRLSQAFSQKRLSPM